MLVSPYQRLLPGDEKHNDRSSRVGLNFIECLVLLFWQLSDNLGGSVAGAGSKILGFGGVVERVVAMCVGMSKTCGQF